MPDSLERLLQRVEALQPTGSIGDGMVGQLHYLAGRVRVEQGRPARTEPDLSHARSSPGPINCNIRLSFQAEAVGYKCERCGSGPCPFFASDGSAINAG